MIIAIDFDGTIVEHRYPNLGNFKKDAKKFINKLHDEGHYIIIWTCRYEPLVVHQMYTFLDTQGVKYDRINQNHPDLEFNPYPKIYADVYIDDRQLGGLPSWEDIYAIIKDTIKMKMGGHEGA